MILFAGWRNNFWLNFGKSASIKQSVYHSFFFKKRLYWIFTFCFCSLSLSFLFHFHFEGVWAMSKLQSSCIRATLKTPGRTFVSFFKMFPLLKWLRQSFRQTNVCFDVKMLSSKKWAILQTKPLQNNFSFFLQNMRIEAKSTFWSLDPF